MKKGYYTFKLPFFPVWFDRTPARWGLQIGNLSIRVVHLYGGGWNRVFDLDRLTIRRG